MIMQSLGWASHRMPAVAEPYTARKCCGQLLQAQPQSSKEQSPVGVATLGRAPRPLCCPVLAVGNGSDGSK